MSVEMSPEMLAQLEAIVAKRVEEKEAKIRQLEREKQELEASRKLPFQVSPSPVYYEYEKNGKQEIGTAKVEIVQFPFGGGRQCVKVAPRDIPALIDLLLASAEAKPEKGKSKAEVEAEKKAKAEAEAKEMAEAKAKAKKAKKAKAKTDDDDDDDDDE